jgi:hypothetical protein
MGGDVAVGVPFTRVLQSRDLWYKMGDRDRDLCRSDRLPDLFSDGEMETEECVKGTRGPVKGALIPWNTDCNFIPLE